MKSAEIRQAFLDFFQSKGHTLVNSSSLVPGNDPTLLFTNSGMVQFKDVFLGQEKRPYSRAASSQRCVRAGGKHNDLENVGYTARHHTFFEMLGNFSFGDYFKRDAIRFAWEFLTVVLGLPEERLWVTVHVSDDEAADIWLDEVGVSRKRFSRLDQDNFWQMGDTGPCGPSSEIFYDHGADVAGGPPGSDEGDLDRYIEIWNLVFMQYERSSDGTLTPLPRPSIDTGMGLERIAAVMQGVHNNYDIDLFQRLIRAAADVTGETDPGNSSLRVIADHIRSCAFLVVDGVLPANEGRGYVLRRIIRRALRHGHKLGVSEPFFHRLVAPLATEMGSAYPELVTKQLQVANILRIEEEQFARTLDKGMAVLDAQLSKLAINEKGDSRDESETESHNIQAKSTKLKITTYPATISVIPGDLVFQLYDTYGFPPDLTNDIARERGYSLDMAGYEAAMAEQKSRARAASHFGVDYTAGIESSGDTEFTGYQQLEHEATVTGLYVGGGAVDQVLESQEAIVILDRTPFYAESGGQVGDSGYLDGGHCHFEVSDCRKQGGSHLHVGKLLSGTLSAGDRLMARVDNSVRQATALNHSATHLLHAALRNVLGEHVCQQGSLVDSERLRFDFSHHEAMTAAQLRAVEAEVNREIRQNTEVQTAVMAMDDARERGAMALFGEKYGDRVRVLTMGDGYSVELCGGTHVRRTGDIGLMRIVSESGIAAGVRRIEAVTGARALALIDQLEERLDALAVTLKAGRNQLQDKARQLVEQNRSLSREIDALKMKLASSAGTDLMAGAREIAGIKVLASRVEGADAKTLRDLADRVKSRMDTGVVLLSAVDDDKVALIAGVTRNLTGKVSAGDLVRHVASLVDGKGGGRPDMAQGGGSNVGALAGALDAVYPWVEQRLAGR